MMHLAVKVVLLGGRKVGKSAVSVRYLTRRYIGEYSSDKDHLYKHTTVMADGVKHSVELLDTSGDWCLKAPLELQGHIEWASAIVLVYDVTDRHSFNSIIKLINVVTARRSSFSPIALIGNKDDLNFARQVEKSEGRNLASKYNLYFFEISAADSTHEIRAVFDKLITHVINAREFCAREMTLTRTECCSNSNSPGEVNNNNSSTSNSAINNYSGSVSETNLSSSSNLTNGSKKSLSSHFTIFGSVLSTNRKNSMSSIKYM